MLQPLCQPVNLLQRKPQGLAHVANRRAGPIGDHLGGHARPFAAIFAVKILNHLFAALVLEIDVDVGRLVSLAADEPLEEHVHPLRIDGRDAQAVTHGRIGRRTASLAENPPPRAKRTKSHTVRKYASYCNSAINRNSCSNSRRTFSGTPPRIAPPAPAHVSRDKVLAQRFARRGQFLGILVTQLVERKPAPPGDLQRALNGLGSRRKQDGHFFQWLQIALGIGKQVLARRRHRAAEANGRQNVA